MSWDELKKSRENKGGSIYLLLKDGEFIEGVFMGEPKMFYQVYGDPIEYPEWAKGRSFKFKINLIVKDDSGNLKAKIFKGGASLRDQLLDCIKEYGLDCLFKIKRTGSSKEDTRYSILFKSSLTPEQKKAVKEVSLLSLDQKSVSNNDIPPLEDDDLPF